MTKEEVIQLFDLKPLSFEGGYYRETFRNPDNIQAHCLPGRYSTTKSMMTSIYFLLTQDTRSVFHKLPTPEIYHFYIGDPVELIALKPGGEGKVITLGNEVSRDMTPQYIVPKDTWQGGILKNGGEFALMGTTMAPGFGPEDFVLPDKTKLLNDYPDYREYIEILT